MAFFLCILPGVRKGADGEGGSRERGEHVAKKFFAFLAFGEALKMGFEP